MATGVAVCVVGRVHGTPLVHVWVLAGEWMGLLGQGLVILCGLWRKGPVT